MCQRVLTSPLNFAERIEKRLNERAAKGLSRQLVDIEQGNHVLLKWQDKAFINFSSNDYLGLANDSELKAHFCEGINRYGNGSAASPLITGFSYPHQRLESTLCQWLGYDRAVFFNSGFSANQALIFTLLESGDLLLQDKLNHASLIEAGALSPATMKRYHHKDLRHLKKWLRPCQNTLVISEGVFSMDGDLSEVAHMAKVIGNRALLVLDDAHGIGVLGDTGAGSVEHWQVKPDLLIVTFGKAYGLSGAAILTNANLGDYLTQFAKHHVYSTAISPALAYAIDKATEMIQTQSWRRNKLHDLQNHYHELMSDLPGYLNTPTPIKPFLVGGTERALRLSNALKAGGFWACAIRPPTVPVQMARLRFTLTAQHRLQQLQGLKHCLEKQLETYQQEESSYGCYER